MRTVLAALDASAAATPVLETAIGIGELTGATVDAVHVRNGANETPEAVAARGDVLLRRLDGPVEATLLDALGAPHVVAAVLGARGMPAGARPIGHTALRVLQQANKPVVVVPPDARSSGRPLRRLVVPLEAAAASARPIETWLTGLLARDVELVVLHVFTESTVPRVLDRPVRDLELLGGEFLARYCPSASAIELRTGAIGQQVAELSLDENADVIVLGWSQDASPGHATVIRDVLSRAAVPVLLLPVGAGEVIDLGRITALL